MILFPSKIYPTVPKTNSIEQKKPQIPLTLSFPETLKLIIRNKNKKQKTIHPHEPQFLRHMQGSSISDSIWF